MKLNLGPFPVSGVNASSDLREAIRSLRTLLRRVSERPEALAQQNETLAQAMDASWRTQLQIVLEQDGGRWTIEGFELRIGPDLVTDGWPEELEGEPPLIRALAEALTEEVWWTLLEPWLPLLEGDGIVWAPTVLLGWHPDIVVRSGLSATHALTLLRLELNKGRRRHTSGFRLLRGPEIAGSSLQEVDDTGRLFQLRSVIEEEVWWPLARQVPRLTPLPENEPSPTHYIEYPKGEEALLLEGWLDKDLTFKPQDPITRRAVLTQHRLRSYAVGDAFTAQIIAGVVTIALSMLMLVPAVLGAVQYLAKPTAEPLPVIPALAKVPGLSFCAADNPRFVSALKCWVHRLDPARTDPIGTASCEAEVSKSDILAELVEADLTGQWCGLLDRDHGSAPNLGLQAAANACLEVLRNPDDYSVDYGVKDTHWADINAFFTDPETRIGALSELVEEMKEECEQEVGKQEAWMRDAIVATHVNPKLIRSGSSPSLKPPSVSERRSRSEIWVEVRGGGEPSVGPRSVLGGGDKSAPTWLDRYTDARYRPYSNEARLTTARLGPYATGSDHLPLRQAPQSDAWACYLHLQQPDRRRSLVGKEKEELSEQLALWGLRFFYADSLLPSNGRGKVKSLISSQLQLDSYFGWLDSELFVDKHLGITCWAEVRDALADYEPIYPLMGEEFAEWPSPSQQICGQVCQLAFGMEFGEQRVPLSVKRQLRSKDADLYICTTPYRFEEPWRSRSRRAAMDLRMRWYDDQTEASSAQACAFHLLSQERLPSKDGMTMLSDIPSRVWAGGDGAAERADSSLSFLYKYAESVSELTSGQVAQRTALGCQYVATQCLTTALLKASRNNQSESLGVNSRDLKINFEEAIASSLKEDQWCQLIGDELSWSIEHDFRRVEAGVEDFCVDRIIQSYEMAQATMDMLGQSN